MYVREMERYTHSYPVNKVKLALSEQLSWDVDGSTMVMKGHTSSGTFSFNCSGGYEGNGKTFPSKALAPRQWRNEDKFGGVMMIKGHTCFITDTFSITDTFHLLFRLNACFSIALLIRAMALPLVPHLSFIVTS